MANKQHEMLFKLGAQLDQRFKGSFDSAQQILSATQKKISELNKQQSDISSYQKQQTAVENTTKRLDMYREQLEIVRQKKKDNEDADGALAMKEVELRNKIEATEQKLSDQNAKLAQMGDKLKDAGVNIDDLSGESARLTEQLGDLSKTEEEAAAEAQNLGKSGAEAFDMIGSALVAAGIVKALKEIADAYMECVETSMEFGSTMSTVEALSGATAADMQSLSAKARELGATTAFTANESASAMTYMGMAGWDAQEMLSGMDGVMALAAASGEDLAMVSDIVTDNLTAFGLKAKDTAHFSDVLAIAASKSNTSVSVMGETFKGSAAIAGALGYSVEDAATAVGLMANAGVKGSVAGTALKNTFNGLLSGATLTSAAFGEVEFSAVNADGTIDSFSESINELRGYFDQMTEAERVQNAMLIAGQRGYNGLLAILNSTEDDYRSLTAEINNCSGAAQRMADIKLDNLAGDVTLLESATDGLKMTLGDMYKDELRGVAQVGTDIINGINNFCEKNPAVVKAIMAVVAEIGLVVAGYTAFTAVKKAKNALDAIGTALKVKDAAAAGVHAAAEGTEAVATEGAAAAQAKLNLAFLSSPIFYITAAVAALTAVVIALREANKMAEFETLELSTATQQQYNDVERLNEEYEKACEVYGETSDQARALKYDLDEANAAIEDGAFSVSELYSELDALHSSTADLLSSYNEGTAGIKEQSEQAQILTAKLKDIANSSETAAKKEALMQPVIEKLNALYPSLGLTVDNVSKKLGTLSDEIDRAAGTDTMQAKYDAAKANLADLMVKEQQLTDAYEKAEVARGRAAKRLSEVSGTNVFTAAGALITGTAQQAQSEYDKASDKMHTAWDDLMAVRRAIDDAKAAMDEYGDTVSGTSDKAVSAYDAVAIAINSVEEGTLYLIQAYNDAYDAAHKSISGQFSLWQEAEETIPMSIGTINSALESQAEYWDNYNSNLENLKKRAGDIEGLSDVIASFADGSKDSVNAIAGMADATDDELKEKVAAFQETKKQQDAASKTLAEFMVDIDGQMQEFLDSMAEAVDTMCKDDEAERAAELTVKAYADAILAGKGSVASAAEVVASAAAAALAMVGDPNADFYKATPQASEWYEREYGHQKEDKSDWYRKNYGHAYASGTDSAASGLALVGENGPELMIMRSGEQVIDADTTSALLSGGGSSKIEISIAPQIVITGNVSDDTEERIRSSVIEAVLEALEQAGIDKKRSVYA